MKNHIDKTTITILRQENNNISIVINRNQKHISNIAINFYKQISEHEILKNAGVEDKKEFAKNLIRLLIIRSKRIPDLKELEKTTESLLRLMVEEVLYNNKIVDHTRIMINLINSYIKILKIQNKEGIYFDMERADRFIIWFCNFLKYEKRPNYEVDKDYKALFERRNKYSEAEILASYLYIGGNPMSMDALRASDRYIKIKTPDYKKLLTGTNLDPLGIILIRLISYEKNVDITDELQISIKYKLHEFIRDNFDMYLEKLNELLNKLNNIRTEFKRLNFY